VTEKLNKTDSFFKQKWSFWNNCMNSSEHNLITQQIYQLGWKSTNFIVLKAQENLPVEYAYCIARDHEFREFAISNMTGISGMRCHPADYFNQCLITRLTIKQELLAATLFILLSQWLCRITLIQFFYPNFAMIFHVGLLMRDCLQVLLTLNYSGGYNEKKAWI